MPSQVAMDKIFEAIEGFAPITRPQLVELLAPDVKESSVPWALAELVKQGKIVVKSERVKNRLTNVYTLPKTVNLSNDNELAELKAWKEYALRMFPQLEVATTVLRAREIVARHVDDNLAPDVLAGRRDNCPIMKAVLEALEVA